MTRFMKESLTRALCAALWCIPGGLWSAATTMAAEPGDDSWVVALPNNGLRCGTRDPLAYELRRSMAISVAYATGEYTDSLLSIAANPRMSHESRERARDLLAATRQPRALRYLATHPPAHELPPLIVHPVP